MLKHLSLKNLLLIENAKVQFGPGLNIITGETGAGKTALIEAIGLALGDRAESSKIRRGAEKASIEAVFEITSSKQLHSVFEEYGIEWSAEDDLLIRRELTLAGKNRAFINGQQVPLPLLQQIGKLLIDTISQHSYHELTSASFQRELVDLFANAQPELTQFTRSWVEEKRIRAEIETLLSQEKDSARELLRKQEELTELQQISLQEEDALQLKDEYNRFAHAQELMEKLGEMTQELFDSPQSILLTLKKHRNRCEPLLKLDSSLKEPLQQIQDAHAQLVEASHFFNLYLQELEVDPNRLLHLEKQLDQIEGLKKRYGSFEAMESAKTTLEAFLSNADFNGERRGALEKAFAKAVQETNDACRKLSEKRKASAKELEVLLTRSLQTLNMPHAQLKITFEPQARSSDGEDLITFLLCANKGESFAPIKEGASGGELSRLLFVIKVELAEKNRSSTLLFDEIDANVGGETAAIIADKLWTLGKKRQVICITHFPQVACRADAHHRIYKEESEGRTLSHIEELSKDKREVELIRMLGGKKRLPL